MFEEQHQARKVLEEKQRRLRVLEVQAAQYGKDCPPHITTEIEDLRKEIEKLLNR